MWLSSCCYCFISYFHCLLLIPRINIQAKFVYCVAVWIYELDTSYFVFRIQVLDAQALRRKD